MLKQEKCWILTRRIEMKTAKKKSVRWCLVTTLSSAFQSEVLCNRGSLRPRQWKETQTLPTKSLRLIIISILLSSFPSSSSSWCHTQLLTASALLSSAAARSPCHPRPTFQWHNNVLTRLTQPTVPTEVSQRCPGDSEKLSKSSTLLKTIFNQVKL